MGIAVTYVVVRRWTKLYDQDGKIKKTDHTSYLGKGSKLTDVFRAKQYKTFEGAETAAVHFLMMHPTMIGQMTVEEAPRLT